MIKYAYTFPFDPPGISSGEAGLLLSPAPSSPPSDPVGNSSKRWSYPFLIASLLFCSAYNIKKYDKPQKLVWLVNDATDKG